MAKKNQQAVQDAVTTSTKTGAQQGAAGEGADAELQTQNAEGSGTGDVATPADDQVSGETVPGLVLSDSIYGKCGEVRNFPAGHAAAIAAAGYIDLHPNAIKSAEG